MITKLESAHEDDINCVVWHKKRNILCSCSDDYTIKLWEVKEEESEKDDIKEKEEDNKLAKSLKDLDTEDNNINGKNKNDLENNDNGKVHKTDSNVNEDENNSDNDENSKDNNKDNNNK
jgi:WD40 repeat protein